MFLRSAHLRALGRRAGVLALVVVAAAIAPALAPAQQRDAAYVEAARQNQVLTGLDVLEREGFARLKGKRIGLLGNHSSINRRGEHLLDLLVKHPDVKITALLSPEHGFRGTEDTKVTDGVHEATGLPIYSLYGKTQRPNDEMLANVDVLVFDIQDIGARFYTYISTLGMAMEECGKRNIKVIVLDRPNPIGGFSFDGPIQDDELVNKHTAFRLMPVTHGMTVGEMATYFTQFGGITCDLEVVKMQGWRRAMFFDECGLPWVNPSPNMRSVEETILYTVAGLTESSSTGLSVGRGTDRPFEYFGAPWIKSDVLAADLRAANLPGLWVMPFDFMPYDRDITGKPYPIKYPNTGEMCGGVRFVVTNRWAIEPPSAGIHLMCAVWKQNPEAYKIDLTSGLVGAKWVIEDIKAGKPAAEIIAKYKADPRFAQFAEQRNQVLIYP